jgi:hypothetical protein
MVSETCKLKVDDFEAWVEMGGVDLTNLDVYGMESKEKGTMWG